jgi:hypothetical protein
VLSRFARGGIGHDFGSGLVDAERTSPRLTSYLAWNGRAARRLSKKFGT